MMIQWVQTKQDPLY